MIRLFKMKSCSTVMTVAYSTQQSLFSITSIDGLNTETANHALNCRMLSGCRMAPSIPVILNILESGTCTLCVECQCLWTLKGSV